jgi:ADP-glucose pyrophosphorylase
MDLLSEQPKFDVFSQDWKIIPDEDAAQFVAEVPLPSILGYGCSVIEGTIINSLFPPM